MEEHKIDKNFSGRLNILRAGVLGANDGIISIAGVVIGVASATEDVWSGCCLCWRLFYGRRGVRIRLHSEGH